MSTVRFKALSSVYGKIEKILLSYPAIANDEQEVFQRYQGIFNALPEDVSYVILAQIAERHVPRSVIEHSRGMSGRDGSASNGEPGGKPHIRIIEPLVDYCEYLQRMQGPGALLYCDPVDHFHTEWVQDPFVVLKAPDERYALLEPVAHRFSNVNKMGDQLLADFLAAQDDFVLKPFAHQVEGGNVLVGKDFALVGSETLLKNINMYRGKLDGAGLHTEFIESFGVSQVLWVGGLAGGIDPRAVSPYTAANEDMLQLLPHLDMFISLGGPDKEGREIVFVAELQETGAIAVPLAVKRRYNAYFQATADYLRTYAAKGLRFRVERLPIILYNVGTRFCLSFNNCLTEVYKGNRNVYMPGYHALDRRNQAAFSESEEEAVAVFRSLGFTVRRVEGNFSMRARSSSSLHCIAKVLQRGVVDSASAPDPGPREAQADRANTQTRRGEIRLPPFRN